jgi:phosphohistidine phosphatase SixA
MKALLVLHHGEIGLADGGRRSRAPTRQAGPEGQAMGESLTRAGQTPDAIAVSPARRAADTVALAAAAGGWQSTVRTSELLYGADALRMLDVARAEVDARTEFAATTTS